MRDADSINRQFRLNDIIRWRALNFVTGYEIHQSSHPDSLCEICSKLEGKYPKGFLWTGWHDRCICYMTPILLEYYDLKEDTRKQLKANIESQEYIHEPKEAIQFLPIQFIQWYKQNSQPISFNEQPDFVTDNIQLIDESVNHY